MRQSSNSAGNEHTNKLKRIFLRNDFEKKKWDFTPLSSSKVLISKHLYFKATQHTKDYRRSRFLNVVEVSQLDLLQYGPKNRIWNIIVI